MSRVTIDRATGSLRIGGAKVFPLGLSNPPPLGGKTPAGKDGLQELADGGASFIRTGRGNWGAAQLEEQLAAERALLDAAAARGLQCWLYLGDLPDLPARSAASGQASVREQTLSRIASTFRDHRDSASTRASTSRATRLGAPTGSGRKGSSARSAG